MEGIITSYNYLKAYTENNEPTVALNEGALNTAHLLYTLMLHMPGVLFVYCNRAGLGEILFMFDTSFPAET